jgi:multidrug transporter EmrE-like cation transporter
MLWYRILIFVVGLCAATEGIFKKKIAIRSGNLYQKLFFWYTPLVVVLGGLDFGFQVKVYSRLPFSEACPAFIGSEFLFLSLLAMLILREPPTWNKFVGMTLVFVGILFLTANGNPE